MSSHSFDSSASRHDLPGVVGRLDQLGGVRLVTLSDGPARGVRVLEFRSGTGLSFDVIVDRGFDIGASSFRGVPLAWISPVGTVGPWDRDTSELGFLRSFGGGLLVTCGLEHAMFTEDDEASQFDYPPRLRETYPLHGRISSTAARLVGYGTEPRGGEVALWAEGEVEQASVFGEHLTLRRRVETQLGGKRVAVADEVVNSGYAPTPHMLLYHVNVGYPILAARSVLLASATEVEARGDYDSVGYATFGPPAGGATEQVFAQRLNPDVDGHASVAVANLALELAVYQRYPTAVLPHHFVWRMLSPTHYVVGLEPSTNSPAGRRTARASGDLVVLQPGQSRRYQLELGVLTGRSEISTFADEIGTEDPFAGLEGSNLR